MLIESLYFRHEHSCHRGDRVVSPRLGEANSVRPLKNQINGHSLLATALVMGNGVKDIGLVTMAGTIRHRPGWETEWRC